MEPLDFIQHWCEFDERRSYILMGIARRAHNKELTHSTEIIHRKVLNEQDDIEPCYRDLKAMMDRHGYTYRIYLTVNARDTLKTFTSFKEKMEQWSTWLIQGNDDAWDKIGRADSEWKSELHSPEAADDSFFLFDCDRQDFVASVLQQELEEHTDVVMARRTPNGWHIITKPFNYNELPTQAERKYDEMDTDGQVFIEHVEP